jgi:hypothetical protein
MFHYTVFPNPVLDVLNIAVESTNGSIVIQLFNPEGQLMLKDIIRPSELLHQCDVSMLSKGIYILHLASSDYIRTSKLVKK